MPYADGVIQLIPERFRGLALRHSELIKFAIVGGTTFVFDFAIFYVLKATVMADKPVTAKVISGIAAMMLSYYLNRQWSFRKRGGRGVSTEAVLFFVVSGIGVALPVLTLWISNYVFNLHTPHVSLTVENIAGFISAFIIGNLLQMAFRFWALRRWVFPVAAHEAAEYDEYERTHPAEGDRDLKST